MATIFTDVTDTKDMEIPSTFANRFIVRTSAVPDPPHYSGEDLGTNYIAVTLPTVEAQGLAMLIKNLLVKNGHWDAQVEADNVQQPRS